MIIPVSRSRGQCPTRKVKTITYLTKTFTIRYPAMAESKKTASKRHAEAYPSMNFQISLVKVDNSIDRRMESPADSLPNDLFALHGTVFTSCSGYSS